MRKKMISIFTFIIGYMLQIALAQIIILVHYVWGSLFGYRISIRDLADNLSLISLSLQVIYWEPFLWSVALIHQGGFKRHQQILRHLSSLNYSTIL